ncbi:hypothetical protein SEA_TORTELLINI_43 [Mycobacterium phage Tortellini]|uniref:Uncharacterized protein n=1 Tax=Mycobacterium phage Tortellini TaxID=1897497 RepID=A0A1D8EX36_9CAUD|nr:hypothetical protein FDH05_gp43 [Mycobacterium phage Tortellini]AOT25788.1 hypothetical protein SEA_TORTELLINI_43 [Mycobacterium phage Tortellini]
MIAAIAGLLRGGADFFDAVQAAYDERRKGFAEREAGDFLDLEDLNLARSSEPQSPVPPSHVVDAEVHCEGCQCPMICGCGREIYAEYERPGAPPIWFHRDDDSPITEACARIQQLRRYLRVITCKTAQHEGMGS